MKRFLAISFSCLCIFAPAFSQTIITAPGLAAFVTNAPTGGGGGGGGSPLITSGLVLYYKFDEGTGTTTADASGNGHTGTLSALSAGIIPSWVTGYIGAGALSFEGSHTYVDSGTDTSLNPASGNFSIVAWAKTSATDTRLIIGKYNGSGDRYWLGSSSGSAFFDVNNVNATHSATTSDGNWHHFVGTRSGSTITLYVDGVSIATATSGSACAPGGNMMVGMFGANSSFVWNGSIDEVAYYNRALSSGEVSTLFNQTHP